MMVRVIYRDKTAGVIESHLLNELIRKGRIVAYHQRDRWVPVKSNIRGGESIMVGADEPLRGARRYTTR